MTCPCPSGRLAGEPLRPVLLEGVNPLPATWRTELEPHPPIGQGGWSSAEDGIELVVERQACDPGSTSSLVRGEP